MSSVYYPYEDTPVAAEFIEDAPVAETVREKICFRNADRLLRLTPGTVD